LLIVEDDEDTRMVLTHYFSIRGYDVVGACTGRQALQIAKSDPLLDIVLLDVFVPEVGGMEVLHQLKGMKPDVGVVMMTALGDREIARHALQLGAFDCLLKPLDLQQVEASIVASQSHTEYQQKSWWKRLIADPAA
jgi:two-component system response regulator (stage 0 sporulation protein F)